MGIDLSRFIQATSREFANREHDGKPARVLTASRTYDTTVEDLWDALTNPARIPNWFMPITGDLQSGGRYQLTGNASGEILQCDPPSHFHITWEFGGHVSWVDVLLSESPFGANLRLEHINCLPDTMYDEFGPGAVGIGWELGLLGLQKRFLEPGPRDFEAAMAWMASSEAKQLVASLAVAWKEADIASGADVNLAGQKAEKTRAFYTGEG